MRIGERLGRAFAWTVVALGPAIVIAWVAAAVAAALFLPGLGSSSTAPIGDVVPEHTQAAAAQERALRLFGSTVSTDTVAVERNPRGLGDREWTAQIRLATQVAQHHAPADLAGVRGAVPVLNAPVPGVRFGERDTTALTYLFLAPDLNLAERDQVARAYVRHLPPAAPGTTRGITGAGPARLAQFSAIDDALPWVELATVIVILAVVALSFRSLLAPLVTLATAAIAYVTAVGALGWSGQRLGARPPSEIEPVLVVLLLGLVTDYTVFFMSEGRRRLAEGEPRAAAARAATVRIAPLVLVAGILVAGGAASLLAGRMRFFQVFGPGLAIAAIVVTLVCVTLVPGILGLIGPRLFGGRAAHEPPGEPGRARTALFRFVTARPAALLIAAACITALGLAAAGARKADLGVSFISSLSRGTEVRQAADTAARGFVGGILAPTDVIVEQRGIGAKPAQLTALQREIARQPGVTGVLGPAHRPPDPVAAHVVSRDGNAARFVVLLAHEPTGAAAIRTLRGLRDRMPDLTHRAGLPAGARVSYGGDTALAAETVDLLVGDLWRVGAATALIMFLLLALFLRALIAPALLLVGGALAFAGSFGLTTLALPGTLGGSELVYYVPLVAAVLLIGLGSDYNVLVVGRIRAEARRRPLREAIAVAVPSASRAITVAGVTLAGTFALLALVPLRPFRELAMLMTIGVLIDALFVRPVLVPAMIAAAGRTSWWPGRAEPEPEAEPQPEEPEDDELLDEDEPRFTRDAPPATAPRAGDEAPRAGASSASPPPAREEAPPPTR